MMLHFRIYWMKQGIGLLSVLFFWSIWIDAKGQQTRGVSSNAIKVDVIGIPIGLQWKRDIPYPRISVEFERRFRNTMKWAWDADFELSRFEEIYPVVVDSFIIITGNIQKSATLLLGPRFYPFRDMRHRWSRILFLDARLGIQRTYARITPFTTAAPIVYIQKWFLLPRIRTGVSLPVSNHLGFELSLESLIQKHLGTRETTIELVWEANVLFLF
jgi:hypothetical protein